MNAEAYLSLDGIELANPLRTLSYLRRGLGGAAQSAGVDPNVVVPPDCETVVVGDIYPSVFPHVYPGSTETVCTGPDPFDPRYLACYCAALDTGPYVDPATDRAPWYTASRAESAEFLGFVLTTVELRPSLVRGFTQGQRGGALGMQRIGGYIVSVTGAMYASSRAGMEYGERWLANRLVPAADSQTVRLLPACADVGGSARWRSLPRAGLVDGPVTQAYQDVPTCSLQQVTFQFASESPWLLGDAISIVSSGAIIGSSYLVPAQEGPGEVALRISLTAHDPGLNRVDLALHTGSPSGPVIWSATSHSLDSTVVSLVDASMELVAVTNVASGATLCALDCYNYTAPWTWPVIPADTAAYLTVTDEDDTGLGLVTVDAFVREL